MKTYNRNEDVIELNENWSIIGEVHSWQLRHEVVKTKDILDKHRKKTGKTEQYTDYDRWWFPKIGMCLERYLEESSKPLKSVQELKEKIDVIYREISKINQ